MDTPVENYDGLWIKREDLYSGPFGVNGSKYRTWENLIAQQGKPIVVAGSVHAPTVPIAAVAAMEAGVGCTVIVGGTTPEKAMRHKYISIAAEAGANIEAIRVGYNPALKKAARAFEAKHGGTFRVAAPEPGEPSLEFLLAGATQTGDLPDGLETLVIPFGSGITASGVLYGLANVSRPSALRRVFLIGIAPDRLPWLTGVLGNPSFPFEVQHLQTYPWFAKYDDRVTLNLHGIDLHPTYEGKVVSYLNALAPEWWTARDGKTCLWIVGSDF